MLGMRKGSGQSSGAVRGGCSVLFTPSVLRSPAVLGSRRHTPPFLVPILLHKLTLASAILGGPHLGGSHCQTVAWAPSAKIKPNREGWDAASQRAKWQASVSSKLLLSFPKIRFSASQTLFSNFFNECLFRKMITKALWNRSPILVGMAQNNILQKKRGIKIRGHISIDPGQNIPIHAPLSKWSFIFLVYAAMY